jgi:hypothetical protein
MAQTNMGYIKNAELVVDYPQCQIPALATDIEWLIVETSGFVYRSPHGAGALHEVVSFELGLAVLEPASRMAPFANAECTASLVTELVGEHVDIGSVLEGIYRLADFKRAFEVNVVVKRDNDVAQRRENTRVSPSAGPPIFGQFDQFHLGRLRGQKFVSTVLGVVIDYD